MAAAKKVNTIIRTSRDSGGGLVGFDEQNNKYIFLTNFSKKVSNIYIAAILKYTGSEEFGILKDAVVSYNADMIDPTIGTFYSGLFVSAPVSGRLDLSEFWKFISLYHDLIYLKVLLPKFHH